MDKGTVNLREAIGNPGKAEAIEREIDHRRHQLNPMVLIGHHPLVVAAAGVVLLGAVTGGVGLFRTRQRKAKRIFYSWGARGKRMGQAIGRLAREPAAAVPDAPSIGKRLFAVGVSAAVAVVAGRMARRFIRRMP
jgi:hypothetical protein